MRRVFTLPERSRWRTRVLGVPLAWNAQDDELLPKRLALPVFSSDALSSVAYAAEAALVVLLAASVASYSLIVPIAIAVSVVMAIVVLSYRQTVAAYPQGGGAFAVAGDNLGPMAGLVAAAALAIDYLLTATVSIAAAVLALTSAFPTLSPVRHEIALAGVALLAVINLRGLRQTGRTVAVPVYGFTVVVAVTLTVGLVRAAQGTLETAVVDHPLPVGTAAAATGIVMMRAFASGCSALTGIEAVANGVPAFRAPQARNAGATLVMMAGIAMTLLLGVSWLAYEAHALPSETVSVLSQLGRVVWGDHGVSGTGFYLLQFFTLAILLMAANTAYQGFPRLLASVAAEGSAPRWFQYVGDRLVLSNGVVALSVLAGALLIGFDVRVDLLIHLYLLGVFLAFTLSQVGMMVYWRRHPDHPGARMGRLISALGALATGIVLLVILFTKFTAGGWLIMIAIPLLVAAAHVTGTHYRGVAEQVADETGREAPPQPGSVIVLVDRLDQHSAAAAQAGALLAGGRPHNAIHVGDRDRWETVAKAWRREPSIRVPIAPLAAVYGDGAEGVAAQLRTVAASEGGTVVAVMPHAPTSWRLRDLRRRLLWRRIRRRLEHEPSVAVTELSASVSGGWWQADRIATMVATAGPYGPARRAIAFAEGLDGGDVWAVHVAGSEQEAEAADGWRDQIPVPLEVVESAYRDLGAPMLAAVHDITSAEPSTVCLLVVPEVLTRRRFRWLHNQRTAILRRALSDEDRTMLMTLPFPVDV